MVTTYHTQLRVKSCSPGSKQPWQEFGSLTPTDLDWVLEVVIGYNTDIDTCTMTKGSTNKISAGHSLELHRAQTAERRAQNAERRAQHAERRAQSTERRARSAEATQGTATTNVPMAHRRRDHVGEARSRSQTCVARSTCKAKRSHRVSAHKEAAQVRTARTLPWRKRIFHEDNEVARRSPAAALRQQSKERRQSTSVTTAEKVARGKSRSYLAERHARMYR